MLGRRPADVNAAKKTLLLQKRAIYMKNIEARKWAIIYSQSSRIHRSLPLQTDHVCPRSIKYQDIFPFQIKSSLCLNESPR